LPQARIKALRRCGENALEGRSVRRWISRPMSRGPIDDQACSAADFRPKVEGLADRRLREPIGLCRGRVSLLRAPAHECSRRPGSEYSQKSLCSEYSDLFNNGPQRRCEPSAAPGDANTRRCCLRCPKTRTAAGRLRGVQCRPSCLGCCASSPCHRGTTQVPPAAFGNADGRAQRPKTRWQGQ
jgi:hypothetical protein